MMLLRSKTLDPAFNLATEEYLFKHRKDDLIFLYRNTPSLIIGKHQNTLAEINLPFVEKHQIPVIRRLSGGGTVYHDEGNINFCFIKNGTEGHLVNFREFTRPILDFLQSKGLQPELGEKNELRINQYKFSGNAEHLVKNRIMHHGTILYNTNLENLEESIHTEENKYQDKAVKSNRMMVCNLQPLLAEKISAEEFMLELSIYLSAYFSNIPELELNENECHSIQDLAKTKYQSKDWNFAYSPMYQFIKTEKLGRLNICIELKTQQSVIKELTLRIDSHTDDAMLLQKALLGTTHHPEELLAILESVPHLSLWNEVELKSFAALFF